MIKRIFAVICAAVMLAAQLSGCTAGGEAEGTTNIVVVLDISDSMKTTDKNGLAIWATDFIPAAFDSYKMPLGNNSALNNTYFGLVTFGLEAEEVIPLTSLGTTSIEDLRDKITKITYDAVDGTDYYAGFNMAYDMCEDNPADRNIIYVLSDGERNARGLNYEDRQPSEQIRADKTLEDSAKQYSGTQLDGSYSVYTVAIDVLNDDQAVIEEFFSDLKDMASDTGKFNSVTKNDDYNAKMANIFYEFIEEIYDLLDEDADGLKQIDTYEYDDEEGVISFTLDKKYKTVSVLIASDIDGTLKLEGVQSPKDSGMQDYTDGMKLGGFLGFDKSTVNASQGFGNINVNIDNAQKGEWKLKLNKNNAFSFALIYATQPFPWYWIPIGVVALIILILLIMWLCYIPPMRYRKRILPGMLTLEHQNGMNDYSQYTPTEGRLIAEIMRGGKFIYHGRMTLATLTGDKRYKKVVAKYIPETEYMSASVAFEGNDSAGNRVSLKLYPDVPVQIGLGNDNVLSITWSC